MLGKSTTADLTVNSSGVLTTSPAQLQSLVKTASSGYTSQGFDLSTATSPTYKLLISTDSNFPSNTTTSANFKLTETPTPVFTKPTISGYKYQDADGNLATTSDETGVSGWKIDINGTYATSTGSNGLWQYQIQAPGTYTITEESQSGWTELTGQTAPSSYSITVDASGNITSGSASGNTFYNFQDITIGGTKYVDTTGAGLAAGQSPYTAGVQITLSGTNSLGHAVSLNTTTDSSGNYSFTTTAANGLLGGTYSITETPPTGWIETDGQTYSEAVSSGSTITGVNFSDFQDITIGGTKYIDTTGAGLTDGQSPYTAGVQITLSGTNSLGHAVSLNTTTDSSGNYSFTTTAANGLLAGTYSITETPPTGWIETDGKTYSEVVSSGSNVTGVNFSDFQDITIGGTKYIDTTGAGLAAGQSPYTAGVQITLSGTNSLGHAVSLNTTTDSSGNYSFTTTAANDLFPGTYTISETVPTGWTETDAGPYSEPVVAGSTVMGVNFSDFQNISISGSKYDDQTENGFSNDDVLLGTSDPNYITGGVTIDLYRSGTFYRSTSTDGAGGYSFTNLGPGTYTVNEVVPSGWKQTGTRGAVAIGSYQAVGGTNSTGNDFDDFQYGQVKGTKSHDLTGNGFSKDDTGLSGVTINLYTSAGSLVTSMPTASNGTYSFTGLDYGTYYVTETVPGGWLQTANGGAATRGITSTSGSVTITSGTSSTGNDFDDAHIGAEGNPLTKGYWTNKGNSAINSFDIGALNALNLRDSKGNPVKFSTTSLSQARSQVASFLGGATSTNPANMLSAQLATMQLNVDHANDTSLPGQNGQGTGVSLNSVVYDPALLSYAAALTSSLPGVNTGVYGLGFISLGDLMAASEYELTNYPNPTQSQTQIGGVSVYNFENELQVALNGANNNTNFVI